MMGPNMLPMYMALWFQEKKWLVKVVGEFLVKRVCTWGNKEASAIPMIKRSPASCHVLVTKAEGIKQAMLIKKTAD